MRPGTRRATALLLALGLVLSSCGGGGADSEGQGPPPTGADDDGLSLSGGDGGDGSNGASPSGSGGGGGTRGASTTTTTTARAGGTSTTTTTTTRNTTKAPNAPDSGARRGVGAFARTLLRPQPATRIVVELLVQPGADPRQGSLDHLQQVLTEETRKPVAFAERVALPAGDGTATASEIRAWSDTYGRARQGTDQAVLRVLFLTGEYSDAQDAKAGSVLGVAVRGDTMAVFKEKVRRAATAIVPASIIEDAVVTHELGHLLGLVDLVVDTGRDDPEHPGHSRNRDSVMFAAVEGDEVAQVLGGPPSRDFDGADKQDLAALRNGA
jgi:hypothetical protein